MPLKELQRLMPRHFKIVDLILGGLSHTEVAQEVGMSATGVQHIAQSLVFQTELSRRRENQEKALDVQHVSTIRKATETFEAAAEEAADKVVSLMQGAEDERVQFTASREVLDRAGMSAKGSEPAVTLDVKSLELISIAISESASARSSPVEVTVTPGE